MNYAALLLDPYQGGVYRLPGEAQTLADAALANDFACWRIDVSGVATKEALLDLLDRELAFPEWFGGNWDALEDCLTDFSWRPAAGYVLILEHCEALASGAPEAFETALEIFDAAADYWYDDEVPFWVFIGGMDPGAFDLPLPGEGVDD